MAAPYLQYDINAIEQARRDMQNAFNFKVQNDALSVSNPSGISIPLSVAVNFLQHTPERGEVYVEPNLPLPNLDLISFFGTKTGLNINTLLSALVLGNSLSFNSLSLYIVALNKLSVSSAVIASNGEITIKRDNNNPPLNPEQMAVVDALLYAFGIPMTQKIVKNTVVEAQAKQLKVVFDIPDDGPTALRIRAVPLVIAGQNIFPKKSDFNNWVATANLWRMLTEPVPTLARDNVLRFLFDIMVLNHGMAIVPTNITLDMRETILLDAIYPNYAQNFVLRNVNYKHRLASSDITALAASLFFESIYGIWQADVAALN